MEWCVISQKTELMVMNCDEYVAIEVDQTLIQSSKSMKVLGLIFDSELDWTRQVDSCIAKSTRMLHGQRHIRKALNKKQTQQFITSFFFSVLLYGCEVWYHRHLFFHLKQRIQSCHYPALRLVHGKQRTRDEIDQLSFRATPDEWADYSVAKLTIKMVDSMMPCRLHVNLKANSFVERRQPHRLLFYDSSCRKIGRQSIKNRLNTIAKHIKFDWFNVHCTPARVRIELKKSFFTYSRFQ